MDTLSIASDLAKAADLARGVQSLFREKERLALEEKGKVSKEEIEQLLRICDAAAKLQHIIDVLASHIMEADRTTISSRELVSMQTVLVNSAKTLTEARGIIILLSFPTESKVPPKNFIRYRDTAAAIEIGDRLRDHVNALAVLEQYFVTRMRMRKRIVMENEKKMLKQKSEFDQWTQRLTTEDQLSEGYLERLSCTQKRYFDKLLFESEITQFIRISATHNQDLDRKTLLGDFNDQLLNYASPDGILSPSSNSAQGSNDLAVILCEASTRSSNTIPLRRGQFVNILEKLAIPAGIHQAFLTGTPKSIYYVAGKYNQRPGFLLRTPVSGTENWTLAISWNPNFVALRGIILGLQSSEKSRIAMHLRDTVAESAHPMNIPLILCEMLMESDSTGVKTHASGLYQVELRTNFHGYPLSSDTPSQLAKTPERDFEDMTRSLNVIISRLAFHEMRIRANAVFVEQITSHIDAGHTSKAYDDKYPQLYAMSQALRERLDHLQTEQRALLLEISCNQKIAQSQLQIVYNLIAQRDNKDSLAMAELQTELARIQTTIANTTKEDSYAMRTIAVMSILFLPGTFVSSFFSMDMFDWQAPKGASVVSFRFWIYWAVTVPLTVVVVSIWFLWLRTHKKHEVDGHKDSTSTDTIAKQTPRDAEKQSWFRRQRMRMLPKDEEKHAIDAIRVVHRSFATEQFESTVRSGTPTAQIQRRVTVLAGPVR